MFTSVGFYLCWGLFFTLFFCCTMFLFPQKVVVRIIVCIIALAVSFIFAWAEFSQGEDDVEHWNNGICTKCENGSYEFTSATRYKTIEEYYYTCDNCGHTEKFSHLMK